MMMTACCPTKEHSPLTSDLETVQLSPLALKSLRKQESWKFEPTQWLRQAWEVTPRASQAPAQPLSQTSGPSVLSDDTLPWVHPQGEAVRIACINGQWHGHAHQGFALISAPQAAPMEGLEALLLQAGYPALPPLCQLTLGQHSSQQPVELLIMGTQAHLVLNRLHVVAEAGTRQQVLINTQHSLQQAPQHSLQHLALQVAVHPQAHLQLNVMQQGSPTAASLLQGHVSLAQQAHFTLATLHTQGGWLRQAWSVHHQGEHSTSNLMGLALATQHTQSHWHVAVHHQAPHCQSQQTFKSQVAGQAVAEFDGTIAIAANAVQSEAHQLSQSLLLNPGAKAYARPWLKIDVDEVVCSHGATVGQLDEAQLFYLQSRGFSPQQAQQVLCQAFATSLLTAAQLPPAQHAAWLRHIATPLNYCASLTPPLVPKRLFYP